MDEKTNIKTYQMIYSTNYAELYRRVMQGETVLALYLSSNEPCSVHNIGGQAYLYISSDVEEADLLGSNELTFIERCKSFNLRFVPDNEPLVGAAKDALICFGHLPDNIGVEEKNELQTILKTYEHE